MPLGWLALGYAAEKARQKLFPKTSAGQNMAAATAPATGGTAGAPHTSPIGSDAGASMPSMPSTTDFEEHLAQSAKEREYQRFLRQRAAEIVRRGGEAIGRVGGYYDVGGDIAESLRGDIGDLGRWAKAGGLGAYADVSKQSKELADTIRSMLGSRFAKMYQPGIEADYAREKMNQAGILPPGTPNEVVVTPGDEGDTKVSGVVVRRATPPPVDPSGRSVARDWWVRAQPGAVGGSEAEAQQPISATEQNLATYLGEASGAYGRRMDRDMSTQDEYQTGYATNLAALKDRELGRLRAAIEMAKERALGEAKAEEARAAAAERMARLQLASQLELAKMSGEQQAPFGGYPLDYIGSQIEGAYRAGEEARKKDRKHPGSGQPADYEGKVEYLKRTYNLTDAEARQLAEQWQSGGFAIYGG